MSYISIEVFLNRLFLILNDGNADWHYLLYLFDLR